jgi:hypothetical protein
MGVIAQARKRAVDLVLRDAIGQDPWPHGGLILIDDPANNRVRLRYSVGPFPPTLYELYSHRLAFEQREDGSVYVTPVAPRRAPYREPGVVYRVAAPRWAMDWFLDGDPPPPRRRPRRPARD